MIYEHDNLPSCQFTYNFFWRRQVIWGFLFCFLWYFVSHDSQTSNSTGCAATTNRQVIYFLKKKPTEMGQQGANESWLRPLEVRKVWHWHWLLKAASQLPSSMLLAVCCCCCCCSRSRTRPQHLIRRPLVVCSSCISLCLLDELEGKWKKISQIETIHQGRERRPSFIC